MPDKPAKESAPEPAAPAAQGASKTKVVILVTSALAVEAAVIGGMIMMFGGPSEAQGIGLVEGHAAQAVRPLELPVAKDRYPNLNSGRQTLYDTEVFITVDPIHSERVTEDLRAMSAQLSMDVASIFRSAHPSYFGEPTLATLRRQLHATLSERFGNDEQGNPIVKNVIITKCNPIRGAY